VIRVGFIYKNCANMILLPLSSKLFESVHRSGSCYIYDIFINCNWVVTQRP